MTNKPTESSVPRERTDVILTNAERRNLRRKLKGSIQVTRDVLNPKKQVRRMVDRQKKAASIAFAEATVQVKRNAPLLAAVGLTGILLVARRPLSRWFGRVKKTYSNRPSGD